MGEMQNQPFQISFNASLKRVSVSREAGVGKV